MAATVKRRSRVYTVGVASGAIDIVGDLGGRTSNVPHTAMFVRNLGAGIVTVDPDSGTAAMYADDQYVLRPGDYLMVPVGRNISAISDTAGTRLLVAGNESTFKFI